MRIKKNYSTNKNKDKNIKTCKRNGKKISITKKKKFIIGGNPKNTPIPGKNATIKKLRYIPPHLRKKSNSTQNIERKKSSKLKSYTSRQYVSGDLDNNEFIEIRPYPLNASILQYMCNNNKISINKNGDVKCEPGLIVNVSNNKKAKVHSFSRNMIDLWEDETTTKSYIKDNTFYNHVKEKDDIKDKYSNYTTQDITYFRDLVETLKSGKYENTDLQFINYNIIEDFEGYKIVGYPDPKHLGPILANSEFMAEYKNIADAQIRNFNDEIVKLYNVFGNSDSNIADVLISLDTDKEYLESMLKVVDISEDEKKDIVKKIKQYQKKIKEMAPTIFNKPNIRIRYIFHILKKDNSNIILSVRELTKEHKSVLERVQFLIDTEIPKKFHIDKPSFNSYYEYGDYFHIETEYIHPTTRLDTFSYLFQKRVSLNELIYSCDMMVGDNKDQPFWSKLKFTYPNKEYNLHTEFKTKNDSQKGGNVYDIDMSGAIIIICNLLTSFDTEVYYRKGNDIYYLLLSANVKNVNLDTINSNLNEDDVIYSVAGKKMYLMKGGVSYKVMKYYKVDKDNKNLFTTEWYIPTIMHNGIYDMPLYEYYPTVAYHIFKGITEFIKKNSMKSDMNRMPTEMAANLSSYVKDITVYGLNKFNDDIIITDKRDLKYIIWILNGNVIEQKDENRYKNIYDITDYKLLEKVLDIANNLPRIDTKNKMIPIINLYSNFLDNSIHIQIIDKNYYSLRATNIIGLRLNHLENIIGKIKLNSHYFKNNKNNIQLFGPLSYQFINLYDKQ